MTKKKVKVYSYFPVLSICATTTTTITWIASLLFHSLSYQKEKKKLGIII